MSSSGSDVVVLTTAQMREIVAQAVEEGVRNASLPRAAQSSSRDVVLADDILNMAVKAATKAAIAEMGAVMAPMSQALHTLSTKIGARLTREELCTRLGVSDNTLRKREALPGFPRRDAFGRYLLSEIIVWETGQPQKIPNNASEPL